MQGLLYQGCFGISVKTFLYGTAILLAAFLAAGVLFYVWLFYLAVPDRYEVAAEIERAEPELDVIDITLRHRPRGRPGDPLRSYLTSFTGTTTLREDMIRSARTDVEISELCGHSVSRSGHRPSIYRVSVPAGTRLRITGDVNVRYRDGGWDWGSMGVSRTDVDSGELVLGQTRSWADDQDSVLVAGDPDFTAFCEKSAG
ncbi:hypothetical protein [Thiosocius teredinicola]|uniref:hypothetical protein n=1 Tax=Thiosocius teredinicola TaxID=1973002 RepID=UPI000F7712E3